MKEERELLCQHFKTHNSWRRPAQARQCRAGKNTSCKLRFSATPLQFFRGKTLWYFAKSLLTRYDNIMPKFPVWIVGSPRAAAAAVKTRRRTADGVTRGGGMKIAAKPALPSVERTNLFADQTNDLIEWVSVNSGRLTSWHCAQGAAKKRIEARQAGRARNSSGVWSRKMRRQAFQEAPLSPPPPRAPPPGERRTLSVAHTVLK